MESASDIGFKMEIKLLPFCLKTVYLKNILFLASDASPFVANFSTCF